MLQEASDLDQSSNQDEEVMFVYAIGSSCVKADEQFYKFVKVEDTEVCFQLDSCAKANVMSRSTYQNLKCRPLKPLKTTNTVLISISDHKLKLCGEVVLQGRYIKTVADVKFFVVEPDVESVLSGNICQTWPTEENLPASQQPVSRVELDDYLELFNGLGCLPGTYPIELSDDAIPVVHLPRKIRVPHGGKDIEELKGKQKIGVIEQQEEPAEWVNSPVVVQKPNGSVDCVLILEISILP